MHGDSQRLMLAIAGRGPGINHLAGFENRYVSCGVSNETISDVGARIAALFREILLSGAAAARCTASSKDKRRRDRRRSRTVASEMIVIAADGLAYLTEAISGDHKR